MSLDSKVREARLLIDTAVSWAKSPVVMSSFGKDSMVMLNLIKEAGHKLPIVCHREPFEPLKYEFSNRVIANEGYTVYDYPPSYTAVVVNEGQVEIANLHQTGLRYAVLPTGIREPEQGKSFLCGLNDLYNKPRGAFDFPWDLTFIGHKSSDIDPMLGKVPLAEVIVEQVGAPTLVFPLRDFTDADVWEYTKRTGLPINTKRYNEADGWAEFADVTYNPDYFHACTACINKDNAAQVLCPKTGTLIPNVAMNINQMDPYRPAYVGGANAGS